MSWFIEFAEPTKEAALKRLDVEVERAKPPASIAAFLREAIEGLNDKTVYVRSTGHLQSTPGSIYNTDTTEVRNL